MTSRPPSAPVPIPLRESWARRRHRMVVAKRHGELDQGARCNCGGLMKGNRFCKFAPEDARLMNTAHCGRQ
jgi:hypothetical protein